MSFSMGWEKSIQLGLKPFILSESIKIILAAILMPYAWKVVKYIKNKQLINLLMRIGIDLGGTKTEALLIDDKGN